MYMGYISYILYILIIIIIIVVIIMVAIKTIRVKEETHERLKQRGKKDESYDDIINNILNITEEYEKSLK